MANGYEISTKKNPFSHSRGHITLINITGEMSVNFKLSYLHNRKSYRSHLLHGKSPGYFTLKNAIKLCKGVWGQSPQWGFGGKAPNVPKVTRPSVYYSVYLHQALKPAKLQAQKSKGSTFLTLWILDFLNKKIFLTIFWGTKWQKTTF